MERTTVYLDPSTKRMLAAAAKRLGVSEAAIIREALGAHLGKNAAPRLRAIGKSRDGGVARELDSALAKAGFGGHPRR